MRIDDLKIRKTKAEQLRDATRIIAIIISFLSVFAFFVKIVFL